MKLNKSKIKKILTLIIVVLAVVMFLHDQFAVPEAAEPALPESSQAVTLPEEDSVPDKEAPEAQQPAEEEQPKEDSAFVLDVLAENGSYTSMEDVADYIHVFGKLPPNFITKNQARDLGWESSEGNLWEVAPGKSIGGDRFGNYEGLLPEAEGRTWTECDIGYEGGYRDDRRIVFSNDGLIYYTDDHYESFTQLY